MNDNDKKLYHYTSIESLALILNKKTIKFNRLDNVDDRNENRIECDGIDWSKYTYVSCWTDSDEENIPLWHMYTPNASGIRICLNSNFIDYENVNQFELIHKEVWTPPSKIALINSAVAVKNRIIHSSFFNEKTYRKVHYIPEKSPLENSLLKEQKALVEFGFKRVIYHKSTMDNPWDKIGCYKMDKWSFQNECRFILFAGEITSSENDVDSKLLEYFQAGNLNIEDEIYIPIKRDMIERMVITLGPDCTEAHKIIVLSLVKDYPNIEVYWSRLGDYPNYAENLNERKLNA